MKEKIAVVEITSWIGMSMGAEHYYGELWMHGKKIELKHRLTKAEALKRNTKDPSFAWRAGIMVSGFATEKKVRTIAVELCRKDSGVKLLLEGMYAVADVQKAVYGDPVIVAKINELYARADVIGFWDHNEHEDEMYDIDAEFDQVLKGI